MIYALGRASMIVKEVMELADGGVAICDQQVSRPAGPPPAGSVALTDQ